MQYQLGYSTCMLESSVVARQFVVPTFFPERIGPIHFYCHELKSCYQAALVAHDHLRKPNFVGYRLITDHTVKQ